jgi:arylsulfatase A-like enzyme
MENRTENNNNPPEPPNAQFVVEPIYKNSLHYIDSKVGEVLKSLVGELDNTVVIITGDHGRGTEPKSTWRSHGSSIEGTDQIWAAAIGPKTSALGLVEGQFYQNQIARTVVEALGLTYDQPKAGAVIKEMISK